MQVVQHTPQPTDIIRTWSSSPVIYGIDSKDRRENPDHHQPIHQRRDGRLVDDTGRVLKAADVPEYIRAEAKSIPRDAAPRVAQEVTIGEGEYPTPQEALAATERALGQQVQALGEDAPTTPVPRRRGRPKGSKNKPKAKTE